MSTHPMTDAVVLLPGILGSVLAREGKDVWAPTPGAALRAVWSLGRSVKDLELHGDDWTKDDLGDGVTAPRVMPDIHLIPGFWTIDGYTGIRDFIRSRFDVVPGRTYFELPYDWRRDNRVAARQLRRLADEALARLRVDNPGAKLILVGHSMGGLVARSFLEQFDGWKDTRMLITFGTPHRGSLNAVDFVANGFRKKLGPLTLIDLSRFLRSMTSVYQLLPTYPCVDLGDGSYRRLVETNGEVPNLDLARAVDARDRFHGAIAAHAAARGPGAYAIHSVVGITQGTKQSARLDGTAIRVEEIYGGEDLGGDGTVPRVSATPVETDDWAPAYQPMFSSDRHGSLQNADPVQTQLLGILTQKPLTGFKGAGGLRLVLDDIFATGEEVAGSVAPDVARLDLVATLTDLGAGRPVGPPRPLSRDADDIHHLSFGALPPGDYRIRVEAVGSGTGLVDPVHGLLSVAAAAEPDE